VNIWQSYQQVRGYFAHFARLAMHRYQSIFPHHQTKSVAISAVTQTLVIYTGSTILGFMAVIHLSRAPGSRPTYRGDSEWVIAAAATTNTVFTLCSQLYNRSCELYANERNQAALERSSQYAYDVIRLTRAARRLCDDVARLIDFFIKKEFLLIYFLFYSR